MNKSVVIKNLGLDKLYNSLEFYTDTLQSYFSNAHDMANIILWGCLLFEIIFIGIKMILGEYITLSSVVKKILFLGIWIYVAQNLDTLAFAFTNSLQKMGGNIHSYNFDYLKNPFDLFGFAYRTVFLHFIAAIKDTVDVSILNIMKIIVPLLFLLIALLCFTISIGIIVILLCLVKIKFYFIMVIAILLVPFNIHEHTRFLGSKVLSVAFFQGICILSMSLVTGLVIESFKKVINESIAFDGISFPFLLYMIIHIVLGLYLILQSGSIIQAFMPGVSTGSSLLQQITSLAISATTGYSGSMRNKLFSNSSLKAKSSLPSAKSRGTSNSVSKENNIPLLQNKQELGQGNTNGIK